MPAIKQNPIGHGRIVWLGVNERRGTFSKRCDSIIIHSYGIDGDMYRGMWRKITGHDVDYIATDGVTLGDPVHNMRQITIIDQHEVVEAGVLADVAIARGMLRENIAVQFTPQYFGLKFSKLPPMSRMVINHGTPRAKVLLLTEENGPCRSISNPIANHYQGGRKMSNKLREFLEGRRGQMAMVRSGTPVRVDVGDSFMIFPPMT